ncbi:unnamed protein product [Cyclocybe aegerita]|uniref:RRM domain-containing protein n=1 Tax=Cyclocybe aegerita TaxID=1973307 RepID=A0A8S0WDJ5_CYCAE|nr:unnamed protein product [Cyclocybe aegerita]
MLPVQNRSWAAHADQVSPRPSPPSQGISPEDASPSPDTTMKAKDDKLPHDASVFVGSLPSNIDQGDLTRMLMEHLSEHTQIKNIKVVRDSKGGVCAFVQCENASSATALIQTLHSSAPKPFLGRILRYEPARAFRTLLISYRTPTHLARSVGPNGSSLVSFASQEVELEVPIAMRIWKHRNSSILYNSEASQAEEHHEMVDSDGLDSAIFLDTMKYDGETLHKLASYFGPLEMFCALPAESCEDGSGDVENANPDYALYPAPHNARRSSGMATDCWEVKWEHRDDCVSALMTLRRVPHLTVTWAHQPASPTQATYPNYHHLPEAPTYSFHVQHGTFPQSTNAMLHTPPRQPVETNAIYQADKGFSRHQGRPLAQPLSPLSSTTAARYHRSPEAGTPFSRIPGSLSHTEEGFATTTVSQKPWSSEDQEAPDEDQDLDSSGTVDVGAQELYIPQTPALDTSSITPLTPGSQFPLTPTTGGFDTSRDLTSKSFGEDIHNVTESRDPRSQREIDPTTLFVGGLEMFGPGAWDEEKVRKFFSRFGGLESVKVVRPLNACAAFAFVKFDNAESPARAVYEEHNRVYEGRAMRVQLRDCNPPKNIWKYGRPRGKFHQNHHGPQRRFNFRPPYDGQEKGLFRQPATGGNTMMANSNDGSDIHLSSLASALPSYEGSERNESPRGSETVITHSSTSDATKNPSNDPDAEQYREWYDEPVSPVQTPAPFSLGSSVSAAGVQLPAQTYPYLPGPYFPPPPWMHPYMHQAPYQVPCYTGYPVYPPSVASPQHIAQPSSPPSPDTGGPATVAPHVWPAMGMYGSYVPYAVVSPRPQMVEQGLIPPVATQAPLMPTGFIQNEQGTLIPVYQPEALDQYMAGSGGTPASLPNARDANAQRWVPYNHGRPYDLGSIQPPTPHTIQNQDRQRNIETSSVPPQRFPEFQKSPVPFRGPDGNLNTVSSPLYRRQGARRECQPNYNAVRNHNNHPRTFNSRSGRPFVQQFGTPQTPDRRGEVQPGIHWER